MALAILDLVGLGGSSARLRIDTGTNRYFKVRFGEGVQDRAGFDWIENVVSETPLRSNEKAGGLLDTATEVTLPLPADRLDRHKAVAQLFSFKTREGRAPAFSRVVSLSTAMRLPDADFALPESSDMEQVVDLTPAFRPPRAVACRTRAEQFSAPAIGDLLTEIIRVAAPVVMNLLQPPAAGTPPAGGTPPPPGAAAAPPGLASLIAALLKQIPGLASVPMSTGQSLRPGEPSNRFANGHGPAFSRPFVFGIDDALIGAAIGQVIQVLPQLMNAMNQRRAQLQTGQNKLVTDLVSDVNRRMMLQQILDAQRQAPAGQTPDLSQLAALLQQAGVDGAAPPAAPVPPVTPQSLSLSTPSSRATVAFLTAPALPFNGRDHVLLAKGQPVRLDVQLVVGEPVPPKPLPKAIVRVVVKRSSDQSVIAEKVVKQLDLAAGATVGVAFDAADLAAAPVGEPVSLLAEIRWLTGGGREVHACGAAEAVLVNRFFLKERGAQLGPERELTDMNRYRAFWNKLWESPALDAATNGDHKLLWKLDATLKYSVLVVGEHPSNGLMETRFLAGSDDTDSVAARTEGRMKGGIELSVEELNKLAALWDGQAPLDADRLEALRTTEVGKAAGGEIVHRLKLDGRAAERGLVWLVPTFSPAEFTLGAVQSTNDAGQVTAVSEERVRLALPAAVRVLGLKSGETDTSDDGSDEPVYAFDGYRIDVSEKVALTPTATPVELVHG